MQHYVSYHELASKATTGHDQLTGKRYFFTYFKTLIIDIKISLSFGLQSTAFC